MIQTIYFEQAIADHPRSRDIFQRFASANRVECDRFGEVFNRKAQNFRLQKQRPALILAQKFNNFLLEAPQGYGIGGKRNFYFSHMLNCIYDCRYCFLQGMYRSAHYVLFVNYEDFEQAIMEKVAAFPNKELYFFSGYDCDSLALEPVTRFSEHFLPLFARLPNAWLELRTKSTQIRSLLDHDPIENCVVAYSFSPSDIAASLEHKAPPVNRRLQAMQRLQGRGWKLGLRFDPLIYVEDYQRHYAELFAQVFARIELEMLHSVSLGTFRLPTTFYQNIKRLYPDERLFAGPLQVGKKMISYQSDIEREMTEFCTRELLNYVSQDKFFPCSVA
jgi:spore photoproduct lyase